MEVSLGPRFMDAVDVAMCSPPASIPTPTSHWKELSFRGWRNSYRKRLVKSASRPGRALTVLEGGTLSDLDNITVRIADVAANLAVLGHWLGDELGSSTFP